MLKLGDFYDDVEILRKIKRADRQAAYDDMDEDEDERQRPQRLNDSDDDGQDNRRQDEQSQRRIKKERHSQAISRAASQAGQLHDIEMDED